MTRFRCSVAMVAALACAGCQGEPLGGHQPSGTGGSGTLGFGGTTAAGGTTGAGGAGPFCGATEFVSVPKPQPPDILILMDRSSSLLQDSYGMTCTGGCGPTSKWALLSSTVNGLVAGNDTVNWGLMLFGVDDSCGIDYVPEVLVGPGTAPKIESLLNGTTPGGQAPTAAVVSQAASYLQSLADGSPKYLLLVSDGKSGCATSGSDVDRDAQAAVTNAASLGIPTFVLGLPSSSDAAATAALNQLALNGGQPLTSGPNAFYTPSDDLGGTLGANVSEATACAVPLSVPVGPGTTLAVAVSTSDGLQTLVPQDPQNGWTFLDSSETTIELNGTYCLTLKQGGYTGVTIDYLCPTPTLIAP